MISIGDSIELQKPVTDVSGKTHGVGTRLIVEKAAHENTGHPLVLATPADWTRHQITHETCHPLEVGAEYVFYAEHLSNGVNG